MNADKNENDSIMNRQDAKDAKRRKREKKQ